MENHQAFADEWIDVWNSRDLDRVLAHYSEAVTIRTPRAMAVLADSQGIVRGRAALADYWSQALAAAPILHFDLEDVFRTVDGLSLLYRNHRGQRVIETMVFGTDSLVELAIVAYADGPDPRGR